jgi:hypothetical protein
MLLEGGEARDRRFRKGGKYTVLLPEFGYFMA